METTAPTARSGAPSAVSVEVLRYFEVLRSEQSKFLEAVAQARSALGHETGNLSQVSAVQGRLTRQFFDAQRSLLQRRAEIDAEVARIAAETEEHANVVLASAVAHATLDRPAPPAQVDGRSDEDGASSIGRIEQSTRQAIAALGVLAVRSKADADALEQVINDAFTPSEPDAARMERELQLVLDAWWTAEVHEGTALVDDARARAAMRLHLAHLEACEIAGSTAPGVDQASRATVSLLPSSVVQTLESAHESTLDDVFAALHRSLAPVRTPSLPAVQSVAASSDIAVIAQPSTPADQFQHFWHHEVAPVDQHHFSLLSILRRIVFPMFAVTSGLALALAWIG
ncbi:MAG: hypothetical protein HY828_15600 [Actinobacteria bacterium]|nr:hypothetical protein [Actinomycetota bacterium]